LTQDRLIIRSSSYLLNPIKMMILKLLDDNERWNY